MLSTIIWTSGNCLSENYICINSLINDPEIHIIGITMPDNYNFYKIYTGIPVVKFQSVRDINPDLIIIFEKNKDFKRTIIQHFKELGFLDYQIICYEVIKLFGFNLHQYLQIKKCPPTIFSPNCWAGITYNYLQLEFKSPTINMFFSNKDYLMFLERPGFYLEQKLTYIKSEYENNLKHDFPVCACGNIVLNFNHYLNFEEANKAWERRKSRVDFNNLLAMFYCDNDKELKRFIDIPDMRKICFISHKTSLKISNDNYIYVNYHDSELLKKNPFWDVIVNMSKGDFLYYNIFALLAKQKYYTTTVFGNHKF